MSDINRTRCEAIRGALTEALDELGRIGQESEIDEFLHTLTALDIPFTQQRNTECIGLPDGDGYKSVHMVYLGDRDYCFTVTCGDFLGTWRGDWAEWNPRRIA